MLPRDIPNTCKAGDIYDITYCGHVRFLKSQDVINLLEFGRLTGQTHANV
jgi:hypothetical protein